jgi:predicted nucleic acid-binding Zn ribbon protein
MDEEHRHCKVCGKVIDVDEEVCSDACRTRREASARGRRNLTYLMYGMIALLLIVLLASSLR